MPTYAAQTTVAWRKSRDEIERTLARYGASGFAYGSTDDRAMILFETSNRQVRFYLPLPDRAEQEYTPAGRRRTMPQRDAAYEQELRQRWRALALVVKAKLEAVDAGIVSFEQEFGMHMVLADGRTVADHVLPEIAAAYASGNVPALLAGPA
jgi:hypothetical protein